VVERKKSKGWKPKPPSQEISKKLVPPVLSPKPVRPPPKPKEPQNQAELVRQALLAQHDTGPVKPELLSKPRSYSEPKQVVRGVKWLINVIRAPEMMAALLLIPSTTHIQAVDSFKELGGEAWGGSLTLRSPIGVFILKI